MQFHVRFINWRPHFLCIGLGASVAMLIGCSPSAAPPTSSPPSSPDKNAVTEAASEPFEYAQVELSEPKLRLEPDGVCWFEVSYKFVRGRPTANYLLTLKFPGTQNACIKEMPAWQLREQGVIRDGFTLQEPNIAQYEIILSEAEVPMNGYTDISNKLTGTVVPD